MKKTIRPVICALLVVALIIGANLLVPAAAGSEQIPNFADKDLPTITEASGFQDVPPDAWYAEAVRWAVENGVTKGTSATTFSPNEPCTRAQMITFLWRMSTGQTETAEEPAPELIYDDYRYIGRLYIEDAAKKLNVGLYDTLSQELVDRPDAAFSMIRNRVTLIGDHDNDGFNIIKSPTLNDRISITRPRGTTEVYVFDHIDRGGKNLGYDMVDGAGNSIFVENDAYQLCLATCNDSGGVNVTITFWRLESVTVNEAA